MKKIVCSLSTFNVGCTFVDWSIHFLAGKDQYYSFAHEKWIPLVLNPLTEHNAHLHDRNHPIGLEKVIANIHQAKNLPDGLYSLYPFVTPGSTQRQQEFSDMVRTCIDHADVIFIHKDKTANWYDYVDHVRADDDIPYTINKEFYGVEKIWDTREHMALNLRFLNPRDCDIEDTADFSISHFRASASDLWCRGVELFQHIMLYLDLPIDPVRWKNWIPIYHEWAQKPLSLMHFGDNFDDTVKCIVNGWYKELPEYTLEQEAMIQHALIYRHNLNLKTWQLEKFPRNAIELHKLLEPNIHVLVHTYEELRNAKFY
jgi:hypothetical protein